MRPNTCNFKFNLKDKFFTNTEVGSNDSRISVHPSETGRSVNRAVSAGTVLLG